MSSKRIAVITGAGQGIGFAIARALGAAGDRVILLDLDQGKVARAAETLCTDGIDAVGAAADTTDRAQIRAVMAAEARIDTVVTAAGVYWDRALAELTEDDFLVWETILQKMKQACETNDFALISEHDIAFHRSLVTRAHSPDLLAIWSAMVSRIRRHFRESHLKYKNPIQIYEEHLPIIEALRDGSLTETLQTIEDHIE